MHTLEEDIRELKVRFDNKPAFLTKQDFAHLTHTIEHLASDTVNVPETAEAVAKDVAKTTASTIAENVAKETAETTVVEVVDQATDAINKKQWRRDTQRAISNKKYLRYTEDGFAIADKTLTGRGYFYINEYIAIPNEVNVWNKCLCISHHKEQTNITFGEIFEHFNHGVKPVNVIFVIKTVYNEELGRRPEQWDGNLESLELCIVGEYLRKIFVRHHSQKYVDGRRVDYISKRSIRQDLDIGRIQTTASLKRIFKRLWFRGSDLICAVNRGITFSFYGYNSRNQNQNKQIGWRKISGFYYYEFDREAIKRNTRDCYTLQTLFHFLGQPQMHRNCSSIFDRYILVKVTINDHHHGIVNEYQFKLRLPIKYTGRDALVEAYNNDDLYISEFIK